MGGGCINACLWKAVILEDASWCEEGNTYTSSLLSLVSVFGTAWTWIDVGVDTVLACLSLRERFLAPEGVGNFWGLPWSCCLYNYQNLSNNLFFFFSFLLPFLSQPLLATPLPIQLTRGCATLPQCSVCSGCLIQKPVQTFTGGSVNFCWPQPNWRLHRNGELCLALKYVTEMYKKELSGWLW